MVDAYMLFDQMPHPFDICKCRLFASIGELMYQAQQWCCGAMRVCSRKRGRGAAAHRELVATVHGYGVSEAFYFNLQLFDFLFGNNGWAIQDSGLNCHDPFPAIGLPGIKNLEPPSLMEMMERRATLQEDDIQNLIVENQLLLASHQALREDLDNTKKKIQMIKANLGDVEAISGSQMIELVEKIRTMEAEILAGAALRKELQQVHRKADKLRAEGHELNVELQKLAEEVEKADKSSEGKKKDPVLLAELDGLQREYQSGRSLFEYKQDINIKQAEQMKTLEMNLLVMTKEVDKLRAEVQNAETRAQAWATAMQAAAGQSGMAQAQAASAGMDPYGSAYNNLCSSYQQANQAGQSGVAQTPAALPGIHLYASPYAYFPAAAYQQATQAGVYAYAGPYRAANPMAYHHAMQACGYGVYPGAGYYAHPYYPGYPAAAGYNHNALFYYPAYATPRDTVIVNGGPATDAANMDNDAGFPAGQVQTSS